VKVGDLVRVTDQHEFVGTVLEVENNEYDRSFFGTIPVSRIRVLWNEWSPGAHSPFHGAKFQSISWVLENMLEVISEG
jgi:hypothetical protein